MDGENNLIHIPARVTIDPQADVNLELINRHTLEPVTAADIFTFSGMCSNDRLDSYFTKMDPTSTLKNYVSDLQAGTALLEGHDVGQSPYGRSYDGQLIPAGDTPGDSNAVRGHWYITRGLVLNGTNTDDAIKAIKTGIRRDLSVGFGGNDMWYRCSSCGLDIWDWNCPHIPGLPDESDRITFAWVTDAGLREVSTVYKGATPGAYIDKARQYVEQGQLSQVNIEKLERAYQVRLDNGKRSFFMPKGGNESVNLLEQLRQAIKDNKIEKRSVLEIVQAEGETFRQPDDIAIRNELGEAATVDGVKTLKKEAEQGRAYVADLIDQAVSARVRAQGEGFDAEKYRAMLVRSDDVDFIKGEIASYADMTAQRFNGGRQTEGEEIDGQENPAPQPTATRSADVNENIFG